MTTDKFWRLVHKNGCWLWSGTTDRKGYGVVWFNARREYAHRVAWELLRGEIPEGLCVLHDCPGGDNPLCVNPDHLWLGTKPQNNQDRSLKERSFSKITREDAREIRRQYKIEGIPRAILATTFGVSRATVGMILINKRWREPQ
jgi:hypothetical protein